jgi:hypothetical protein
MPSRELGDGTRGGRRRQRLSRLLLAALLAVVGTLLVAAPASADGWPLAHENAPVAHDHDRR